MFVFDPQVTGAELLAVLVVPQPELSRVDRDALVVLLYGELRYGQLTVNEHLRSVILDFRALVDPRAGAVGTNAHLTLRMGEPREWLDRCNTLADPDRMEAALQTLRATCRDWGEAADAVLREFVEGMQDRRAEDFKYIREGIRVKNHGSPVIHPLIHGQLRTETEGKPASGVAPGGLG